MKKSIVYKMSWLLLGLSIVEFIYFIVMLIITISNGSQIDAYFIISQVSLILLFYVIHILLCDLDFFRDRHCKLSERLEFMNQKVKDLEKQIKNLQKKD